MARSAANLMRSGWWLPLLALGATGGLDNGERTSLSQAFDGLKLDFSLTDSRLGMLPTAIVIAGVLGAIPIGFLADRINRTRLIAIAVLFWTVFMGLSAMAGAFAFLFVMQMGVGVLQATDPASLSLLGDYVPEHERARAMSVYQFGSIFGALVGTLVAGFAVDAGGWQAAFWMWIPLGLIIAIVIGMTREPRRGAGDEASAVDVDDTVLDVAEHGHLPEPTRPILDEVPRSTCDVLNELRRTPTLWIAVTSISLAQFIFVGLSSWGIEFFKREYGLTAAQASGAGAALGLGAVVGIFAGGNLADRMIARGDVLGRVKVAIVAALGAGMALFAAYAVSSLTASLVLFAIGGALLTAPVAPMETIVLDVVVPELRGRASAVRTVVRSVAAFGPAAIGALSDAIGLRWALASIAPVFVLSGLVMMLALRTYPADLAYVLKSVKHRS